MRSSAMVPGWLALAVALLCFGGGYVVRGVLTPDPDDGAGLQAATRNGPRAPGVIEAETDPLANQGYVVAAYEDLAPAEAKGRAVALSRWLQAQGFEKARPYEFAVEGGRLWGVVVYYDGPVECETTGQQLRALPADVPDPIVVGLRNLPGSDWPMAARIR